MLDLFCILAFLPDLLVSTQHYRGFVALRSLRLIQFLRLERQSKAFKRIFSVFRSKKHELFSTFYVAAVLMLLGALVFWFIEIDNPNVGTFGDALWWSTTIVPDSVQGRIFAGMCAVLGVVVFALPAASILAIGDVGLCVINVGALGI
eukprot:TRINITY_DN22382_c0_g1_i1.p2 TRINITY_DN22382_c0_g1~~TRINITY_DN22382_c0_g1_i1.p2  ORF type:complete len:148 (-),score=20.84 TRINITY_DN22382_c0_g1_i1:503-946(-)